jgi:asparagine synthase (glutamine-hydrolysing)
MQAAVSHRGPDGAATFVNNRNVSLGMMRLAMVDSQRPAKLISNEDGSIHVAYNGEIYNHKSLRKQLLQKGHRFNTDNDGEVIVHLYEEYGPQFLSQLDGMFAFALWDEKRETLLLARDALGIKPLFFRNTNETLVFASEIKAVLAFDSANCQIDSIGLANYFDYRCTLAPRTIFKGITKLEPGNLLIATRAGMTVQKYWEPHFDHQTTGKDFGKILSESVGTTASCDHPLGLFLSGGLDSSSILALSGVDMLPMTFTIGYESAGLEDEGKYAALLSRQFQRKHKYVPIMNAEVPELVNSVIRHLDEPLFSTVGVSTYALARLASRYAKGVLTGDGSDELLMGYSYLLPTLEAIQNKRKDWRDIYKEQIGWLPSGWRRQLLQEAQSFEDPLAIYAGAPLDALRYFETRYRLPDYHLTRVDRLSMAHGLEARVPFLRQASVDWALAQPATQLLVLDHQKDVLKRAVKGQLPTIIAERPKQPFTSPYTKWLEGPLKREVHELLLESGYHDKLGLRKKGVEALVRNCYEEEKTAYPVLWGVFTLYKWYDLFRNRIQ